MKELPVKLIDRKEIADNTFSFIFDISNVDYKFEAGQYAHLRIPDHDFKDNKNNTRPLSIASSPDNRKELMIAARIGSSAFINYLAGIPIGSRVFISEPSGNLTLPGDDNIDCVFIVGGIGITPVRSIVEYATQNNLGHKLHLFYLNHSESQTAFKKDFEKWDYLNKNFSFIPVIDRENKNRKNEFGPFGKELLYKYLNNLDEKNFYLTGPPQMVNSVKKILIHEGVPEERINTEKFI